MKKVSIALAIVFFLAACVTGYVVSKRAAIVRIAKADYLERTGEAMDRNHSLEVFSSGDVWLVTVRLPFGMIGGGPAIEIDKKTGEVVRRYRTQ
jgi:hypothetical protein